MHERNSTLNKNPSDYTGKVTLVTGAAAGMGLATTIAFAEAGAAVVLADVQEETVSTKAARLREAGHKAIAVRCDVTDDAEVRQMVKRAVSEFDRVSNNLRGVWSYMKYELRYMQGQRSGAIINNASIGAVTGSAPTLARDEFEERPH